jgi:dihydrofolate reductase
VAVDRPNIVVTAQADFRAEGAQVAASLPAALALVAQPLPAFCIGGGELYRAALPHADIIYLTEIDRDFDGDAHFPPFDRARWCENERTPGRTEGPEGFAYAFVTYAPRASCAPSAGASP